jgi:hypothetical protein
MFNCRLGHKFHKTEFLTGKAIGTKLFESINEEFLDQNCLLKLFGNMGCIRGPGLKKAPDPGPDPQHWSEVTRYR